MAKKLTSSGEEYKTIKLPQVDNRRVQFFFSSARLSFHQISPRESAKLFPLKQTERRVNRISACNDK